MPARLPPTEKFPLAVRKNIRDEWDSKKADEEKSLSEILGTEWTIEANPADIHPYASSDWGQNSIGSVLYEYFSSAIRRIKDFSDKYDEAGVGEINTLCPAHVLTLDFDTEKTSGYCRAAVVDGKLTMLFTENNLGTNIDDALGLSNLEEALNTAPEPEGSKLSYHARRGIREEYEPEIEKITSEARELLKNDKLTFKPDFESLFEKLKASKEVDRSDWDTTLGSFLKYYFEGFVSTLKWQKFGEDELLQEGFNDVVDKNEVAFRVVDKLERKTYNEVVIEDGVVYIQTVPKYYGTNTSDACQDLLDLL
ncbi:hypothetical protein jhhlp_005729 [Lomentospora prolificans]|uniref:Uncharacterized protein n=1 Tax=Lomentospora prolificans TaxID=41688 RepID=A0A2N3N3X5_9PEZI|nr:hypothetical protein jhhlp_005729 [Lomentospora prolificans]